MVGQRHQRGQGSALPDHFSDEERAWAVPVKIPLHPGQRRTAVDDQGNGTVAQRHAYLASLMSKCVRTRD